MNKNQRSIVQFSTQSWFAVAKNTSDKCKKNKNQSINKSTSKLLERNITKSLQVSGLVLSVLLSSNAKASECKNTMTTITIKNSTLEKQTCSGGFYSAKNILTGSNKIIISNHFTDSTVNNFIKLGLEKDNISIGDKNEIGNISVVTDTLGIHANYLDYSRNNTFSGLENVVLNGNSRATTEHSRFELYNGSANNGNLILNTEDGADNFLPNSHSTSVNAENIIDFETIKIINNIAVNLSGKQLILQNSANLSSNNVVEINSGSQLGFNTNTFTIVGGKGVINHGGLNLRGNAPGQQLQITGDYVGSVGSNILFNTRLGNDSSITDKLVIFGNTSGSSNVLVQNSGGIGGATINGIKIIEVQGNSDAVFTLATPVQVGIYEYFLYKTAKDWSLMSKTPSNISETPIATPSPLLLSEPTIYRPAVSGYLQAAQAQFDQINYLVGSLEHRQSINLEHFNIWGRTFNNQTHNQSSTFEHDQSDQTLQFGKNTMRSDTEIEGTRTQVNAGITVNIGQQVADYFDTQRAFTRTGNVTGQSYTNNYGLGVYYTRRNEVNPYIDLQAIVISNRTEFIDIYDISAKQNGLGVALSAEMGKIIGLGTSEFGFTPQAQIIYQAMTYDGFDDSISVVGQQEAQSMRARLGVAFHSNKKTSVPSKTDWSASLNLWQELIVSPTRMIAGQVISPENNSKPWLELGIGVSHQLDEDSSFNAQVCYKHSVTGKQYSGNAINISYNLGW